MANVFGILTAIVLALAGFVAYKNQNAYKKEIDDTTNAKSKLASNQNRFKVAQENLASTLAKDAEVDAEVVKLTEDETSQKKANDDLNAQIKSKTEKVNANKDQLDTIRDKTAKIGDLKELADKMRATNAELTELAENITAADAKLANLVAQNNSAEAQINGLQNENQIIASSRSLPGLSTRIRSIYPLWGFVTLAAGNTSGVVTGSTLDVTRDGSVIAKLLVTAVERNSASASIIPDSVAADTTLMVGDKVVPSASAPKPAAPAAAPQAAAN